MPNDTTQYRFDEDETSAAEELETLDRDNPGQPPVEEAAALIFEILTERDAEDARGLHDLLNDVPRDCRNDVMTAILRHSDATMLYRVSGSDQGSSEHQPTADRRDAAAQHQPDFCRDNPGVNPFRRAPAALRWAFAKVPSINNTPWSMRFLSVSNSIRYAYRSR